MKTGDMHLQSRLRLGTAMLAISLAAGALSACTTVEKGWTGTKDAVTGLFSDDDKAAPPDQTAEADAATETPAEAPAAAPMTGGLFMGSQSATSAFQTSTPQAAPAAAPEPTPAPAVEEEKPAPKKAAPKKAEPKKAEKAPDVEVEPKKEEPKRVEGLVGDTQKAAYTETTGRRAPVTVRPLNENAQTADASAPPRPAAAPVEQVARLQGDLEPAAAAPASTPASAPAASAPAAPRAAELAERLDAPAPTPAPSPVRTEAPAAPPAPTQMAAIPAPAQQPIQALIPAPAASSIVSYGDDTIVVDSSGTRGGAGVLNGGGGFDPGNASVSSEVGTVVFSGNGNISTEGKAILADAARLRSQTDGAIRVVGRGNQATARAAAVSRELRRLGVPAARLYDGGADSAVLGDAADIYLDY